jgi:glyoxylase-like metal-dependent hydrolase (beta-lactamase superfamily II)
MHRLFSPWGRAVTSGGPLAGVARWLGADLRCVLAPNPSPMTGQGTNSYLVGRGQVTVIDPGPLDQNHLSALLQALEPGEAITQILVTHSHRDHSPLARPLAQATGARILAFGDSLAGRSKLMASLADRGGLGGGEGVDVDFRPDHVLDDGAEIRCGDHTLRAIWTPGHFGNHLCFQWGESVFSGDHVMAWASSVVSPPDGDLAAFMDSLTRLEALSPRILYPGHGDPVHDPASRIAELRRHRLRRTNEILAELTQGPRDIAALTAEIYRDVSAELHPVAARNVFAHLIALAAGNIVSATPELRFDACFQRVEE